MSSQPTPPEFVKMRSCNDIQLIQIDGIIGAGKTFFIECLVEYLESKGRRVGLIKEPVNRWQGEGNILESFYKDPKRWAYTFQTIAFVHRVKEIKDCLDKAKKCGIDTLIAERGPYTDRLFVNVAVKLGNINKLEMGIYPDWWEMWAEIAGKVPDKIIYLNTNLDVAMRRVVERNRLGEGGVTIDYQRMLKEEHDTLFASGELKLSDEHNTEIVKIDFSRQISRNTENICDVMRQLVGHSF